MTTNTAVGLIRNELEIPIHAAPAEVWRALFDDVQSWWHPDFHMAGASSTIRFEPTLGGRLYETTEGGGGLCWYQVIALEPKRSVTMTGTMAPPFAGPSTTTMHIALEEREGGTLLTLSESVFGHVSDEMKSSLEQGWRQLFEDGLKRHLEG